jgi:hypothetical protein
MRYPCHLVSTSYQTFSYFHGEDKSDKKVSNANRSEPLCAQSAAFLMNLGQGASRQLNSTMGQNRHLCDSAND